MTRRSASAVPAIPFSGLSRRRAALAGGLAAASLAAGGTAFRAWPRPAIDSSAGVQGEGGQRRWLPWSALLRRIDAGGPNPRLGLVQGQHAFVRGGFRFVRGGLVRVRIPASLIGQGDEGWSQERFEDGWWMERLRDLGVPVKAVVELSPRFSDEQHASHAARLVRRTSPGVVIIGNELNVLDGRPGVDVQAEIERYLDRYAAMRAAIKGSAPDTRVQLYGEAYDGEPSDRNAFLRRVLAALQRRQLPLPDLVGIHVYDRAEVLPARVAGYRRLLADLGLHLPVSVEEMGPRQGVIDAWDVQKLTGQPARDPERYPNRWYELRAHGWLTEDEQADLVAQQLATAAVCADQAQVFCSVDVPAEMEWRRGLVSGNSRARPSLESFRFVQRLLNDVDEAVRDEVLAAAGVISIDVVRHDGLTCKILWSSPLPGEELAPARSVEVPPFTFICDAHGTLVQAPERASSVLELPAATTSECGGPVRLLL